MTTDVAGAYASLVAVLWQLRNADGGWPYFSGRQSRLESTCWALLGTSEGMDTTPLPRWVNKTGLLIEPATGQVNYAFNAIAALAASAERDTPQAITRGIVSGLLAVQGVVIDASPVIQQDTTLQGWSWTPGTFTWVEPTAWAMLAVKRWPGDPAATRRRVDVAERVLRDRACAGGGWNFGNGVVYGNALPAHVPPTAAGVMALQDHASDALVEAAVGHLERHARVEGSTTALALSTLALMTLRRPCGDVVDALVVKCAQADRSSNAASLGMAACALSAAAAGRPPRALTLAGASA